jgi:drug/metabolite transporter (DMT)-like permease
VVVVLFSLLSAAVFGTSVAIQHHEAKGVDSALSLRPGLLASLARRPLWLIGLAGDIGGFALQTVALSFGSLVVVQPLLTLGLVVALGVGAWLSRRRLVGWEWRAVAGVLIGLVAFYLAASPTASSDGVASVGGWVATAAIIGATIALALTVGRRAEATLRAVSFAVAAGCAEAVMAVISKAFGDSLGQGIGHTFTSWEPYTLVGLGIVTLLLVQSAYQLGRSTVTLPVLTVSEPLVSTAIGIGLFGERIHLSVPRLVVTVGAVLVVLRSLVVLARDPELGPGRQDGGK